MVEDLRAATRPVRLAAPDLRWSEPDRWHVTLAFLGPVPDERRADLDARLARVAARHGPIPVETVGGGRFGDRVLWTQVREVRGQRDGQGGGGSPGPGRDLAGLAAGVRRAAERARAAPEADARPLRAHLTLARVPDHARRELAPLVDRLRAAVAPMPWTIDRLVLMSSVNGPPGTPAIYAEEAGWPLTGR
nr:2'-5' RNA ligase family protein [Frankia canadensis]